MATEKKLVVNVANCNVKKLDLKAYGISKARCQVIIKVGDKQVKTTVGVGLDPTWEETFEFPITDENVRCSAVLFMGESETEGGDCPKQIGDEQVYLLNTLVTAKPTFKAIIVPGGKVDMMFTAYGFGKEDVPEDNSAFLDLMGDAGGMIMDDDEEQK